MDDYADFELWVSRPSPARPGACYDVAVTSSPMGPATGSMAIEPAGAPFASRLAIVSGQEATEEDRREFGTALFRALFAGAVADAWNRSCGWVDGGAARGLRVRLWVDPPELACLPWELMFGGDLHGFLATSPRTPFARYLPVPEPPLADPHATLRVAIAVGSQENLPRIPREEVLAIETDLRRLGQGLEINVLDCATVRQIQEALQRGLQVVHYLGHGAAGKVVLTGEDGHALGVGAEELSQIFWGRNNLRLVVLNACASAQVPGGALFSGVGPALVRTRVPAVVAMQYPFVQLDTASKFNCAFYGALRNGLPVDAAVNEARQAISADDLGGRDWSTPVLYMGTRRGRILNLEGAQASEVERAWTKVASAASRSADSSAALDDLVDAFTHLAERIDALHAIARSARAVADLAAEFEHVAEVKKRAGGYPPALDVQGIERSWAAVRANTLGRLEALTRENGLGDEEWRLAIAASAGSVERDLSGQALGSLMESLDNFGRRVAEARHSLEQRLDRALDELEAETGRTIGRIGR